MMLVILKFLISSMKVVTLEMVSLMSLMQLIGAIFSPSLAPDTFSQSLRAYSKSVLSVAKSLMTLMMFPDLISSKRVFRSPSTVIKSFRQVATSSYCF